MYIKNVSSGTLNPTIQYHFDVGLFTAC